MNKESLLAFFPSSLNHHNRSARMKRKKASNKQHSVTQTHCEFLEHHGYGDVPPSETLTVYQIPVFVVISMANPEQYNRVASEIAELILDIESNGIKEPLEIISDSAGACRLKEGHHRLRSAATLGMTHVPVVLLPIRSKPMKGYRQQMLPAEMSTKINRWFQLLTEL